MQQTAWKNIRRPIVLINGTPLNSLAWSIVFESFARACVVCISLCVLLEFLTNSVNNLSQYYTYAHWCSRRSSDAKRRAANVADAIHYGKLLEHCGMYGSLCLFACRLERERNHAHQSKTQDLDAMRRVVFWHRNNCAPSLLVEGMDFRIFVCHSSIAHGQFLKKL